MASFPDALPLERRLERRRGSAPSPALRDAFRLSAVSTSVAEARRRVLHRLRQWHVAALTCDNAQLVVSELFTNAVRHTDSERVDCELRLFDARLRVEVTDHGHGPGVPLPRVADADGESGRGLMLVSMLSADWGVRSNADGAGHAVWAELPHPGTFDAGRPRLP